MRKRDTEPKPGEIPLLSADFKQTDASPKIRESSLTPAAKSSGSKVRYPYSTEVFPQAFLSLFYHHVISKTDDDEDPDEIFNGVTTHIMGVEKWSPLYISFILNETEEDKDSKEYAVINPRTKELMTEFFNELYECPVRGITVRQATPLSFTIGCTHPGQLYRLIKDYVEYNKLDTLDDLITEDFIEGDDGKHVEIKTLWEKVSFAQSQMDRYKIGQNQNADEIAALKRSDLIEKHHEAIIDFLPARILDKNAMVTAWVMKTAATNGVISLEALRYAILHDTNAEMPVEFALRNYQ